MSDVSILAEQLSKLTEFELERLGHALTHEQAVRLVKAVDDTHEGEVVGAVSHCSEEWY